MKKLIILLIAVTASCVTFSQNGQSTTPANKPDTTIQVAYYCGMHPDVTSDEPGKCSKCGMELLERKVDVKKSYTCPMHPAVVSDKPGKCPKCGMALVEKKTYTCSMHPEIISSKPGKCPKCGMGLVEKKTTSKKKTT